LASLCFLSGGLVKEAGVVAVGPRETALMLGLGRARSSPLSLEGLRREEIADMVELRCRRRVRCVIQIETRSRKSKEMPIRTGPAPYTQ
jgi:hypothetical protein